MNSREINHVTQKSISTQDLTPSTDLPMTANKKNSAEMLTIANN